MMNEVVESRSAGWELAEQREAPLFEALRAYMARDMAAFHTPGHKQGRGMDAELRALLGEAVFRMDLTQLPEVDRLSAPEGVIRRAQELAARAYGADHTFFLVNGSTVGNEAMVLSVCGPGQTIILPRNAHQSMLGGLILSGARPVYLQPVWDAALGLAHTVTPAGVEQALRAHPEARAVCVLHPTYFGAAADLRRIAELCHAHGKPLLVDEAHGAHLGFHPGLPSSALQAGADLVVQSTHKLTGAMTQASMLHLAERGRASPGLQVSAGRVRCALQLLQSTSPSYVLLASLDVARRQMALEGRRLLAQTLLLAEDARQRLNTLPGVAVFGRERRAAGLFDLDVTRLTIDVTGLGMTGFEALEVLNRDFDVQSEMATLRHVLLLVTPGNTVEDLERVVRAFTVLSQRSGSGRRLSRVLPPDPPGTLPEQRLTPREAFFAPGECIPFEQAVGRVSAEWVAPYPPGIPLLVPGEVVSAEAVDYLRCIQGLGGHISGPQDPWLRTLQVVAAPHDGG